VGAVVPFRVGFELLFGWVQYLLRTMPAVRVNWWAVLSGVVYLTALALGLHLFLSWLYGQMRKPTEGDGPVPRWKVRWSLAIVGMVVLVFAAGIAAVGITHQTAWLATSPKPLTESGLRSAAAKAQSRNNLKQIVLAMHTYHLSLEPEHLPPGGTFDAQGRGLYGWQTDLLPYIDKDDLYKQINLKLPWNHPDNAAPYGTVLSFYLHPTGKPRTADGLALTHYAANVHILGGNVPLSFKQIEAVKGTAQTILIGEAAGNFKPWGHHANWRDPAAGIHRSPNGFGNPAGPKQPTVFGMADGSVRTFSTDTDPAFLELLALPNPKK
jgi:hypothetical protein